MNERECKNSFNEMLFQLESDLSRFNEEWYQIHIEHGVVENETFLKHLADDILKLDHHACEVEKSGVWKNGAHLIHYILETPWGAPFVTKTSLLEAATDFSDQKPLSSSLYEFTKQYATYSSKCNFPILENLKSLQNEIHEFKLK